LPSSKARKIALVSDAGMPLGLRSWPPPCHPVSPPQDSRRAHPGPSALLAFPLRLAACPMKNFCLLSAFCPARRRRAPPRLERLRIEDRTLILYEARCIASLESVADAPRNSRRPPRLPRPRSPPSSTEEFLRGKTFRNIAASLEERPARGEITLLIRRPRRRRNSFSCRLHAIPAARVEELMHQAKLDRKDALKLAAKERGLTRRRRLLPNRRRASKSQRDA